MTEYLIEVLRDDNVTHVVAVDIKNRTKHHLYPATESGYRDATKFKVKDRAIAVAKKIPGTRVVPSYGGYVESSKSSVAPIAGKVNKFSPYRSM